LASLKRDAHVRRLPKPAPDRVEPSEIVPGSSRRDAQQDVVSGDGDEDEDENEDGYDDGAEPGGSRDTP
jgi:hypothetical protein